jgi:hypothetical protein
MSNGGSIILVDRRWFEVERSSGLIVIRVVHVIISLIVLLLLLLISILPTTFDLTYVFSLDDVA